MSKLKQFLNSWKREYDKLQDKVLLWWHTLDNEDKFTLLIGGLAILVGLIVIPLAS